MKPIICFHSFDRQSHCTDGWMAAMVAYSALKELEPELIPCVYGESLILPVDYQTRPVYFLDVVPTNIDHHWDTCDNITIIDHHVGMEEKYSHMATGGSRQIIFDLHHSAAVLAWTYFMDHRSVPAVIRHVEDYDLWRFAMPGTREIIAALNSYPQTPEQFHIFARFGSEGELFTQGTHILRYIDQQVDRIIAGGLERITICGHNVFAVNSRAWVDQIGSKMSGDFGVIYHDTAGFRIPHDSGYTPAIQFANGA